MNLRRIGLPFSALSCATAAYVVFALGACSSAPLTAKEQVSSAASALTGTLTFDSTCFNPTPTCAGNQPVQWSGPAPDPANILKHLRISEAYTRIAANSPAFRECLQTVMSKATSLGMPGSQGVTGPYQPCAGDPGPPTIDAVMSAVLSPNGSVLTCNYCAVGTSEGGRAGIGNIDASGREPFSIGNALGLMGSSENCTYNPDFLPCADDGTYNYTAGDMLHEIMHTHGYTHVADSVWGLNNINIGDVYGHDANTGAPIAYTIGDFCGNAPAWTPGNGGVAPTTPSGTPTPGLHPVYNSSVPYEAGECLETVLDWSLASGHLHDDCGANFAGLKLVDSVLSGTPQTVPAHCVSDPYTGAGAAPVPPHAPNCYLTPSIQPGSALTLSCDSNANPVQLERHQKATTTPWQSGLGAYDSNFDYRVCAVSMYGKACATPIGCPTYLSAETRDGATTSFRWGAAPFADFYRVIRTGVSTPSGPLPFPGVGTDVPSNMTSENMPFDGDNGASYSVCAYDPALTLGGPPRSCCVPAIKPLQTTCYTITKCRVHGKEVVATDTDDPVTWCSDVGGKIVSHEQCDHTQP